MYQKSIQQKIDWSVLYIYLALIFIGVITIYAAEYQDGHGLSFSMSKSYSKQLMFAGLSVMVGVMILLVDSKLLTTLPLPLYLVSLFILALVAVVARGVNGANAWLEFGGFKLQPSEFAKGFTALYLAKYLSQNDVNFKTNAARIKAIAIISIPALIIIAEKDTGSALVFGGLMLVLYREGLPGEILVAGIAAIVLLVTSILLPKFVLFGIFTFIVLFLLYNWRKKWRRMKDYITWMFVAYAISSVFVLFGKDYVFNKVLQPHQRERILITFGVKGQDSKIAKGAGYNVIQSKIAIGSGGFFGKGYLHGTQTKFNFVPEQTTDFIFCTIGEEWGFMGALVLLGLYLMLLMKILSIAERQRSRFSRVYAYGVACIFFMHILINIGMTVGLLPVIGIPLPFISYGGSSMIGFSVMLFILVKLDTDRLAVLR